MGQGVPAGRGCLSADATAAGRALSRATTLAPLRRAEARAISRALRVPGCASGRAVRLLGVLACLPWGAGPGLAQEPAGVSDADCALYRGADPITRSILIYETPPAEGGVPETRRIAFRPGYAYAPAGPGGDEPAATGLFEIEVESGLPPAEPARSSATEREHFVLLVEGLAYSRPDYSLAALAGAPVAAPFSAPGFETTGATLGSFEEITIDGQADDVSQTDQIFVEDTTGGEITALMRCTRPGARPNPVCQLLEQVGPFSTSATFRRAELDNLPTIRRHVRAFAACLPMEHS